MLQHIDTRLLVSCITKPEVPRLIISFAKFRQCGSSFFLIKLIFNSALNLKKYITNEADISCEITVATAAPFIPRLRININTGSNIRLAIAPIATESIPIVE